MNRNERLLLTFFGAALAVAGVAIFKRATPLEWLDFAGLLLLLTGMRLLITATSPRTEP